MASDEAIAALPESGRGLAIMKACVDDVTMSSGPEKRDRGVAAEADRLA